jgi:hypothetical protein
MVPAVVTDVALFLLPKFYTLYCRIYTILYNHLPRLCDGNKRSFKIIAGAAGLLEVRRCNFLRSSSFSGVDSNVETRYAHGQKGSSVLVSGLPSL